jgi:PIN domain nuclease of toxin-antitoxin system
VSDRPILLDTCAVLWLANNDPLSADAERSVTEAADNGALLVSPISAWEIGLLVARGRLALSRPPPVWFDEVIASGVILAPMPPRVLMESSALPGTAPRDPADRILAATARAFSYRLMTRDEGLLDYGRAGHAEVIAC